MSKTEDYYNSLNKDQCIHMLNELSYSISLKENDLERTDDKFGKTKEEFKYFLDMRRDNFDKACVILLQMKKADLIENIMLLKTEYSKTESRLKYLLNNQVVNK